MKKLLICLAIIGVVFMVSKESLAQRKAVSAKEVTGTFKTSDGANIVKILSAGKDDVGYNLQVEFFASLRLGPDGDARGNTGTLSGFAQIEGDTATFTPAGMDWEECTITMKFVSPGVLNIEQEGECGFINHIITTTGNYRKKSNTKPEFTESQ